MWWEYLSLVSRHTGKECSIWWRSKLTFKQFLQDKTLNSGKNKSYYQQWNVKRLRAFHKQAMIKQKICKNILESKSGMDYSPGIQFQTSLINMDEAKALTMKNQPGKSTDKTNSSGVAS